jgi:uncharacterized Rmd1/YagE family protein
VSALEEVIHATPKLDDPSSGDLFLFDYGTVVFWGITAAEEQALVHNVINPCKQEPLALDEVEIDEFGEQQQGAQEEEEEGAARGGVWK